MRAVALWTALLAVGGAAAGGSPTMEEVVAEVSRLRAEVSQLRAEIAEVRGLSRTLGTPSETLGGGMAARPGRQLESADETITVEIKGDGGSSYIRQTADGLSLASSSAQTTVDGTLVAGTLRGTHEGDGSQLDGVQRALSGGCAEGSSIRAIGTDGAVTCEPSPSGPAGPPGPPGAGPPGPPGPPGTSGAGGGSVEVRHQHITSNEFCNAPATPNNCQSICIQGSRYCDTITARASLLAVRPSTPRQLKGCHHDPGVREWAVLRPAGRRRVRVRRGRLICSRELSDDNCLNNGRRHLIGT